MDIKLGTVAFAIFLFLAWGASSPAQAQAGKSLIARDLVDGCRTAIAIMEGQEEPPNLSQEEVMGTIMGAGTCTGYLQGFIGASQYVGHDAVGPNTTKMCVPSGVTILQLARLLSTRLAEKPEFEHVPALPFVIGVLGGTWPCGTK